MDLDNWRGAPRPVRVVLDGAYARLEPLDPHRHARTLFEAAIAPGAEDRFRYLSDRAPDDLNAMQDWAEKAQARTDALFLAVIDRTSGRAEGRQALLRMDTANGVIEVGAILWGPAIARTRIATEALFLVAEHVFALGYRRLEWKCDSANQPSCCAAARFGFRFEGIFRQHMVIKGLNRDTAWFAIIDSDWPHLRTGYQRWLKPDNFDGAGRQLSKLAFDG